MRAPSVMWFVLLELWGFSVGGRRRVSQHVFTAATRPLLPPHSPLLLVSGYVPLWSLPQHLGCGLRLWLATTSVRRGAVVHAHPRLCVGVLALFYPAAPTRGRY
jgi:hypothetical protein